jgi:hypothetical protein
MTEAFFFQLWRPTDNYLAVRISSAFSFVIAAQFIARVNCSKDLPKEELPLSPTHFTHQSIVIRAIESC